MIERYTNRHFTLLYLLPSHRASPHFGRCSFLIPLKRDSRVVWLRTKTVYRRTVTHLSTNRARRRATSLMYATPLPLRRGIVGRLQLLCVCVCVCVCVTACSLLQGRKERRRYSVNRSFYGDYINLDAHPQLRKLLNDKRERVEFADYVTKYDRRGKARPLFIAFYFIFSEREREFTFAICCRPSVCLSVCLSVCNARAPYSGGCNFPQYFYGVWYLGHPLTSMKIFTEIIPGEEITQEG